MKIDLYNNHQTFIQESRQNQAIDRWCHRKGITRHVLETHPRIRDIQFLIEFHDEFYKELKSNASYIATFNAFWGVVYAQRKPLRSKAFRKFEKVALGCLDIRKQNQLQILKIHRLRHNTGTSQQQNKGHDNEAKGPDSLSSNVYEKEIQRGGREVQELLPWE